MQSGTLAAMRKQAAMDGSIEEVFLHLTQEAARENQAQAAGLNGALSPDAPANRDQEQKSDLSEKG